VEVPEKHIPYFKPGKELKDLINHDARSETSRPAVGGEAFADGGASDS